jgi:hypothetical protein
MGLSLGNFIWDRMNKGFHQEKKEHIILAH